MDRFKPQLIVTRTAAPAAAPVSLADAKAYCRVDTTNDDDLITALVAAATRKVEQQSGKALITQTWQVQSTPLYGTETLFLPVVPVISPITSISYYDAGNNSQSATVSDFHLYGDADRAWLEPKTGNSWPAMYNRRDAVTITHDAGFGAAGTAVPETLIMAIKMTVLAWYDDRGLTMPGQAMELPAGAQSLIELEQVGWVAA